MRLGVTGTQRPQQHHVAVERVAQAFGALAEDYYPEQVTTGAAHGIDTIAFLAAYVRWPRARHLILTPTGLPHNHELVRFARQLPNVVVEGVVGGYLKRDDRIVEHSDVLAAFPRTPCEEQRSGTWATIRRGRRANIRIHEWPLRVPR